MTECERLIKEGFVTEDFLKEEVICDYTVTTELKKMWAIELDLLREFERVCNKYNLRWYGAYGTMLGAIRHKGFIPWDDDMDVAMPREDYEILTKELCGEFNNPYFLQTPHTDNEYAYSFAKLRNINTCFASKAFIESPMNQGIFLDIYPMDLSPEKGMQERREKLVELLKDCSAFMSRHNKKVITKHTERAKTMKFMENDGERLYDEINRIAMDACQDYGEDEKNCKYISNEVCAFVAPERYRVPKEIFITMRFESWIWNMRKRGDIL